MLLFPIYLNPKAERQKEVQWVTGKHRCKTLNRAIERSFLPSLLLEVYLDRHFCRVPSLFLLSDLVKKIITRVPYFLDLAVNWACHCGSQLCKMLLCWTDMWDSECTTKSALILTFTFDFFPFLYVSFIPISMYVKSVSTSWFLLWKKSSTSATPANSFTL